MKYHKHIIKIVVENLGHDDNELNKIYEVYKDDNYINSFWSLSIAKEFIDNCYDSKYLEF